jgi:hypothetical protein
MGTYYMNIELLKPGQVYREGNARTLGDSLLLCTLKREDDGRHPFYQTWTVMHVKTGYLQQVTLSSAAEWYLVA